MKAQQPSLPPGSRAVLHVAPGGLSHFQGRECSVETAYHQNGGAFAQVRFDGGEEACLPITYLRPVEAPRKARRSPLTLKPDADTRTEQEKQQEGIAWLQERGYKVLVVGQYMKRIQCEECGKWQWPRGYGNSPGYPDLSVSHPVHWAAAGGGQIPSCLIEYKRSEKEPERTPAQLELQAAGISVIVWSVPMLARAIFEFEERWIPAGVHPQVREWLEKHGLLPGEEPGEEEE